MKKYPPDRNGRSLQGFTLTEVMLAMLLSSAAIAGGLALQSVGQSTYRSAENLANLEERAAFAMTAIAKDIRQAGYWGLHADGEQISVPPHLPVHCGGNNVSDWALQPHLPIVATDGDYDLPCSPSAGAMISSDTLTLRYASSETRLPVAGDIQLHTNPAMGQLFADGVMPDIAAPVATHDLHVNVWYIDSRSSEGNLPALRRYTLTANGLMQNQEIMPGVEDLQVLLGVDRDGDNSIDSFVEPRHVDDSQIAAVQIELRLRSANRESHKPATIWPSIDPEISAFTPDDHYQRVAVRRTITLRNLPPGLPN